MGSSEDQSSKKRKRESTSAVSFDSVESVVSRKDLDSSNVELFLVQLPLGISGKEIEKLSFDINDFENTTTKKLNDTSVAVFKKADLKSHIDGLLVNVLAPEGDNNTKEKATYSVVNKPINRILQIQSNAAPAAVRSLSSKRAVLIKRRKPVAQLSKKTLKLKYKPIGSTKKI